MSLRNSLCVLRVLCVSVVNQANGNKTAETQSPERTLIEKLNAGTARREESSYET
jgi:hypothetical protein